ncbi:MAG: hypothetical protein KAJ64_02310 [Thermoplasmata archaeon]|nr:hypothetical protein [Thermoplasmata archaeon]
MKLIPAMTILHRRVAIVENGRYEYLQNPEGQFRSPTKLAQEFDSNEIFILDIDGLERSSPNLGTIRKIAAYKDIWLDAGTQDVEDMMDLFVSDASQVIFGTKSLRNIRELEEAAELSEKIILSIDYHGKIISPDREISGMSIDQLVDAVKDFEGLGTAILMDLGSQKDKTPVDMGHITSLVNAFSEVYVSAHVIPEDFSNLEDAGIKGIIWDFRTIGEVDLGQVEDTYSEEIGDESNE